MPEPLLDSRRYQDVADHGCFHVLLDRNTGVLLVRNTTSAVAAMHEWRLRTAGAFQASALVPAFAHALTPNLSFTLNPQSSPHLALSGVGD